MHIYFEPFHKRQISHGNQELNKPSLNNGEESTKFVILPMICLLSILSHRRNTPRKLFIPRNFSGVYKTFNIM